MFRKAVVERWAADGAACAKCGLPAMPDNGFQVSHFLNVRKSSVRFEPDNVDPLHPLCHTGPGGWEYRKKTEYREHMARKLGEGGLERLERLASTHVSLEAAKATFLERLEEGTLWQD